MKIFCPFLFILFFFFFLPFSMMKMFKNVAITNDPCYSDYESDDESDYGSSNSEINTGDLKKEMQ